MVRPFAFALAFVLSILPAHGEQKEGGQASELPRHVELLVRWLPQDTDTVIVSQERFKMQLGNRADYAFQRLPTTVYLGLCLGLNGGWNELRNETIVVAVSGSRGYRNRTGREPVIFEGCDILQFDPASGDAVQKAVKECMRVADREDEVVGQKVGVFKIKPKIRFTNNELTFFLANPKPTVLICATDRTYLQRVLRRMDGNGAGRALPESLPEWRHVDLKAPVWAVRHYRKDGSLKEPVSATGAQTKPNVPDPHAVGFVFWYDDNPKAANAMTQHWNREQEGRTPKISQVAPDVVEVSLPHGEGNGWKPFSASLYELLWPDNLREKTANP